MLEYKFEEEEEEEEAPTDSKVKIGETEYTMDELSSLVADGQFKREVETKQNTKLDKVMGEYTKLTQERSGWQQERDEYLKLKQEREQQPTQQAGYTPEQIEQARKEARNIGLFTKDDVEEYVSTNFPKYYVQQREADRMLEKMEKFQDEINGEDGRPKFKMEEILEHQKQTGIRDPFKAYKDKYETELDTWKEKQLLGSKREGLRTETQSTAGGKQPAEVKVTRDNLGKLMREALQGS
jgi:hypothetical protein